MNIEVDKWPLVGRESEFRRLQEMVARREACGLVLAGPAGVGKTRLAREGLRAAELAGFATGSATATRSAAAIPFGALSPLLPDMASQAGGIENRAALMRRFAMALANPPGGHRLALLVDDAHLLDDASATLVHQLVAMNAAFVLLTVRNGEPAPDAVVALWKDRLVERMELSGLQAKPIEELLSLTLGGPVDPAMVTDLMDRSRGNVLFLQELVLGALQSGDLHDRGGIWRLAGQSPPSDRLIELVQARLAGLSDAERDLLEVVSVGEPLGRAELMTLGDLDVAERLERQALLFSWTEGRRLEFRLAHPVHGEVLRARMPRVRIRAVARSLAEVVEATGARRRQDTLRIGSWRLEGGGGRPEGMLAAAFAARWRYDFPLAERLGRAAMEAGAGFEAALLLAQLATLQGRSAEAETAFANLSDVAATDTQRGLVAIARLDNLFFWTGRYEEGIRIADEAQLAINDPTWAEEIEARRASLLLFLYGPKTAAGALQPLLDRTKGRPLVWASQFACFSLSRLGRHQAALDVCERGYAAQLALVRPLEWYPWMHHYFRCWALAQSGRLAEAEALASRQYDDALRNHSTEAQAFFSMELARITCERGQVQTASKFGRESVVLFRELGRPQLVQFALQYLALTSAFAGNTAGAKEALADFDAVNLPEARPFRVDLLRARAWTEVSVGDLRLARQLLLAASAAGKSMGDLVGWCAALHDMARLGWANEVVADMDHLAGQIEGPVAATCALHTQGLSAHDPVRLADASAKFEEMGLWLLAAEAATDCAVVSDRNGNARQAAASAIRAEALAGRCEGARTPGLQAIETRAHLTPAEFETAILAAAGNTSKEIAAKLVLSRRTIENRLQRVYTKLGVSSRAELAIHLDAALVGRDNKGSEGDASVAGIDRDENQH